MPEDGTSHKEHDFIVEDGVLIEGDLRGIIRSIGS